MLISNPTTNFMYKPAPEDLVNNKNNNRYSKGTE